MEQFAAKIAKGDFDRKSLAESTSLTRHFVKQIEKIVKNGLKKWGRFLGIKKRHFLSLIFRDFFSFLRVVDGVVASRLYMISICNVISTNYGNFSFSCRCKHVFTGSGAWSRAPDPENTGFRRGKHVFKHVLEVFLKRQMHHGNPCSLV